MAIRPSSRAAQICVSLGVVLCILPFVSGGGTAGYCPIMDTWVFDILGFYPPEYRVRGVDLSTLSLYWYDGCNGRSSSLVPAVVGIGLIVVGYVSRPLADRTDRS